MKKILLIDDLAKKGWASVLQKAVVKSSGNLFSVSSIDSALDEINQNKHDLIFLDVRMTEEDHNQKDYRKMTGYLILKEIKRKFTSTNFSTPVILLTASNKIWIIEEFKELGIDAFYIKEHPDNRLSNSYSRQNLERLQENYLALIRFGEKRNEIWYSSKQIIELLDKHKYFKQHSGNNNVKERIIDKLKLGYYYRFKESTSLEKDVLKADNESIAFLVYFSILEELSKGYTKRSTWNERSEFSGNWKFMNNEYFIRKEDDFFEIKPYFETGQYITKKIVLTDYKYSSGHIKLSEQVYALLYHYGINDKYKRYFSDLNDFRNKLSYTHSSIESIYYKSLVDLKENKDSKIKEDFNSKIEKILSLIKEILQQPS